MTDNVEKISDLAYRVKCEVSQEEVTKVYQKHLDKVSSTIDLKGFRKGKVPVSVVESKFGKAICQEVAGMVIQTAFDKAVKENEFKIAGQPDIDAPELTKGQSYAFSATFETYPIIDLVPLEGQTVEKVKSVVSDKEVDARQNTSPTFSLGCGRPCSSQWRSRVD